MPSSSDFKNAADLLGITLPTPAYIVGAILFGIVGIVGYRFGRKRSRPKAKWTGVALMLYPYVIPETWMMYAVGVGLCGLLYWFLTQENR